MPDTRIGISGWTYAPWRGAFYPEKLPQKDELRYASRAFNSIEINGTFYSLQRPSSFQTWYEQTPLELTGGLYVAASGNLAPLGSDVTIEAGKTLQTPSSIYVFPASSAGATNKLTVSGGTIDNAFGAQVGVLPEQVDAMVAAHAALFGQRYVHALAAVQSGFVPEPAAMSVFAVAGVRLLRRRIRRVATRTR